MKTIPLPPCGMFIGSAVYWFRSDYIFQTSGKYYTSWISEDHAPEWYLQKTIEENQGNTVLLWDGGATHQQLKAAADWLDLEAIGYTVPEPDWQNGENILPGDWPAIAAHAARFGSGLARTVKAASALGLYSAGIYADADKPYAETITADPLFLGYNIGEKFSFRLEDGADGVSLREIAERFCSRVRKELDARRAGGWRSFLVTSASFHTDYEVIASEGTLIPDFESFAFNDLNFGAGFCRGLQRQFELPYWGSHLAHEHYSFLPYRSADKFKLLNAGFYSAYLNGAKMVTLESGNWFQQSDFVEDTPMHAVPKADFGNIGDTDPKRAGRLVAEVRKHYPALGYESPVCRKYREALSDFYDFVKTNGTPPGLPEVTVAAAKGNLDLSSQSFNPNLAVGNAYAEAERNPQWYEGAPEKGWEMFRALFYPRRDIMNGQRNKFLAGTPYGPTDIVTFAAEVDGAGLAVQYQALIFPGWNTASEKQYSSLLRYVESGGTLLLSLPQLSTDDRRNYHAVKPETLVNGGDFSELCGAKILGRGRSMYWALTVKDRTPDFPPNRLFGIFGGHIGKAELAGNIELLAVHDESFEPVLWRFRRGKGSVIFLNTWEYPGAFDMNDGPGATYASLPLFSLACRSAALAARGNVFIAGPDGVPDRACDYIAYSHFPSNGRICLLNTDFHQSHAFDLHVFGNKKHMILSPGEFRLLESAASPLHDIK